MLESKFQKQVIDEIKRRFPYAIVLKNDASYLQGVPDLVIFCGPKYAMLEVKNSETAARRPNQSYYVERFRQMGAFSAFIFPENKDDTMTKLATYFQGSPISINGGEHVPV